MAASPRGLCTTCRTRLWPVATNVSRGLSVVHPFSTSSRTNEELQPTTPVQPPLDPQVIASASSTHPPPTKEDPNAPNTIRGPARRRAAIATSRNIPFEQLPYQCFQEARKVLAEDRAEKIEQIVMQRGRIARLKAQDPAVSGGEAPKSRRIASMQKRLEDLKIWADVNDPLIKKQFEDGEGDMSRPIYRYYARRKWHGRPRMITMQRITQMNVMPDFLPKIEPTVRVSHTFGQLRRHRVEPGAFVPTFLTLHSPKLSVQTFDQGEKLVTVAIVDGDVVDYDKDNFRQRCHFLACNIRISPTETFIGLEETLPKTPETRELLRDIKDLPQKSQPNPPPIPRAYLSSETQLVHPYLAPWSSKGAPYHRLAIFVLQQQNNEPLDTKHILAKNMDRDTFKLRSFVDRHRLSCIGVDMFRTHFDDTTDWSITKIRNHIHRMQKIDAQVSPEGGSAEDASQDKATSLSEAAAQALAHPPSASRRANDERILEQLDEDAETEYKHKRVEPLPLRKKPGYNARFR